MCQVSLEPANIPHHRDTTVLSRSHSDIADEKFTVGLSIKINPKTAGIVASGKQAGKADRASGLLDRTRASGTQGRDGRKVVDKIVREIVVLRFPNLTESAHAQIQAVSITRGRHYCQPPRAHRPQVLKLKVGRNGGPVT